MKFELQADVPECSFQSDVSISDEADRDELLYRPGYTDIDEEKCYVRFARAFRALILVGT